MASTFPYNDFDHDPSAPVADITFVGTKRVTISALIDSGSDGSMIPFEVLLDIGAEYVETRRVRGVFSRARSMNLYFVDVQLGGYDIPAIRVVAIEPGQTAIIGRDILNHLIVTLDGIGSITEIS